MKNMFPSLTAVILLLSSVLVTPSPSVGFASANAPMTPDPPISTTATLPPAEPESADEPPLLPPAPGNLPCEVEEARAREAIEGVLDKHLDYWGPRYEIAPIIVTVEDEWAHGEGQWRSQSRVLEEPINILAHRSVDGSWRALMPSSEGLYPQWLNAVPESLVSAEEKTRVRAQTVEVDVLLRRQSVSPTLPVSVTLGLRDQDAFPEPLLEPAQPTTVPTPQVQRLITPLESDTGDWLLYRDADYGFALRYPSGWSIRPSTRLVDEAVTIITNYPPPSAPDSMSPSYSSDFAQIEIGVFLHGKPLTQSLEGWAQPAGWMLPLMIEQMEVSVGGVDALQQTYDFGEAFVHGIYIPRDTTVYFVSITSSVPTLSAELQSILDTFRFVAPCSDAPHEIVNSLYPQNPSESTLDFSSRAPTGFRLPFDGNYAISNGPGEGYHSVTAGEAIDFPMVTGTPIRATEAGTVTFRDWSFGYGWSIELQHSNGMHSWYAHLSSFVASDNQQVSKGDVIAESGNSSDPGYSTGAHLHFHVRSGSSPVCMRDLSGVWWNTWFPPGDPNYYSGCACYPSCSSPPSQCYDNARKLSCGSGDNVPPDGDITSPNEGATINNSIVTLAGWASDDQSGFDHAHFTAYYNGSWRQVGPDFTSSPFSFDWDMCNDGVPDGQVTVGLDIWDQAGNQANSPHGNRNFTKSYNCSPPPSTGDWNARYEQGSTCWWDPNCNMTPRCTEEIGGPELHKDWGSNAPCGGMDGDDWVGDFDATINFSPDEYVFRLNHDDGAKLWLNGSNISISSSSEGDHYVCNGSGGYYLSGDENLRVMLREEGGEAHINLDWTTDTSVCAPEPSCDPNSDQIALYADANYGGSCVTLNVGDYPNPADLGDLGNDNAESIRVGSNAQAILCQHDDYQGRCEPLRGDDANLGDNHVGGNAVSSVRVEPRTSDWHVEYFSDNQLGTRCHDSYRAGTYAFGDWAGDVPASGCPTDYFSARLSRIVDFPGGDYTFALGYDDGARIKVDGQVVADGWSPSSQHYVTHHVGAGYHYVVVEYYENTGDAYLTAAWRGPGFSLPQESQDTSQWYAQYWGNRSLWWDPVVKVNEGQGDLYHQWDTNGPGYNMPGDNFSSRFERSVNLPCGRWRFNIFTDDGVRFWIDDTLILDEWQDQVASFSPEIDLDGGVYELRIEHYESGGGSTIQLDWQQLSGCAGPVVYDSYMADDDSLGESSGDDDGIVECGESIELYATLLNQGDGSATGVNACISTDDPNVSWLYNTCSDYPDLSGGGTGANSNDFDFAVDPTTSDGHLIQFDLDVTASNSGPWSDSFEVYVACPQPDLTPSQWPGWEYPVVPSSITGTTEVNPLIAGYPTYIDWGLTNEGSADTGGDTYGDLYVDDVRVAHTNFGNVFSGDIWAFFDWVEYIDTPGWHTLKSVVDPDDLIDESVETNNVFQRDFYWAPVAPYVDDMESGTNDWTTSGLWHQVNEYTSPYPESNSGSHSWWYGQDTTGDYDTGVDNSGDLTSPPIYIPDTGHYLRFWYRYETETQGPNWDRRWIQISVDGAPFQTFMALQDDPMNFWLQSPVVDLSPYAGHTIQIRFHFDTVDDMHNGYRGWYVDDFEISTTPPPTCADGHEPNDTPAEATSIVYGQSISADICPGGDYDFYTFTGGAGDKVAIDVDAMSEGSLLDSYIYLLRDDGITALDEHDDEILGQVRDPLLGYHLPYTGTYYIKVKAWNHPSAGSADHFYTLNLLTDDAAPSSAEITAPAPHSWLDPEAVTVDVSSVDQESGVNRVEFLWHDADWENSDWVWLGADQDGRDGWSFPFDTSAQTEQRGSSFYIWAFDWVGNWTGASSWNLGIDRTPPTTVMGINPMYGDAPFRDFWVNWWGSWDNLAGITGYDVQYRDGAAGTWVDLAVDTTDVYTRFVGLDGRTYYFRARARDAADNQSVYATRDGDVQRTIETCYAPPDAYEVDDDPVGTPWIVPDEAMQMRNFHVEGDQDWVRFYAAAGISYTLATTNTGGHADTVLHLYEGDGTTWIDSNDDYTGIWPASKLYWQPSDSGFYQVMVEHWDPWAYGCTTEYGLTITGDAPTPPLSRIFLPLSTRR